MSGRPRREALYRFRELLQATIATVSSAIFIVQDTPIRDAASSAEVYSLALNGGDPCRLPARPPLTLSVRLRVVVEPRVVQGRMDWSPRIVGYAYTVRTLSESEIVVFHWHPGDPRAAQHPHIHIGSAMIARDAPARPTDFHRAHIPTGQIFIEDVVRFAIAELGVTPLRSDWDTVLAGIARRRGQVT